jgi:ferredoxin-NADP reductase/Na+-translocating ferredoxin:NAD+ oxidoreductase RnfD subunit
MLKAIDKFLNDTTMYRLVLYYLTVLVVVAFLFDLGGVLPYSPVNFLFSTLVLLAVCWVVNTVCSKIFEAPTNIESVYITAFILALIIDPVAPTSETGIAFLVISSTLAMASKYILALEKKHIFNPAALGIALSTIVGIGSASWWVGGNIPLLPFVVIGGLLVVRKIRRADLVATFAVMSLVTIVLTAITPGDLSSIQKALVHTPFFFFAFVMLTEPITMPPTRGLRMIYAGIVGILFAPNIHIAAVYFSPELALIVGNVFSFMVSSEGRYTLRLIEKHTPVETIDEFVFLPDRPIKFLPGQYLEWTLPHKGPDTRGNRRYFTIASSPTEDHVRLGIKFYEPTSSFKIALGKLEINDTISAAQVAGDFVLPRDKSKKLCFIAGGIGVTPFRSHVQYMVDKKQKRDVVLLYASRPGEIVFQDIFARAAEVIGMKTVYIPGMIDAALIKREVPDYKDRTFYISGPPGMVDANKKLLRGLGVSRFNIKTDYFPGLA